MELKKYSNFILRLGLGIVFLFFGVGKLRQDIWFNTIKAMEIFSFFGNGIDYFIYFVGVVEILVGILLIIGLWIRLVAWLAALQIFVILILIKFGEIRDIGLLGAALYLALVGDAERK